MLTETVAGRTYDYSYNVGRGAAVGMGFNNPVALALDADGVVYVANRGSESISNVPWDRTGVGQRISKVSLGSQSGEEEYLGEFSRYGSAPGQLIWPAGVVVDAQGNVYVTDEWLNRVSVFDKEELLVLLEHRAERRERTQRRLGHRHRCQQYPVRDRRSQPQGAQVRDRWDVSRQLGSLGNGAGELDSPGASP